MLKRTEIHSGNIIDKITDYLPNFVDIKNRSKLQTQNFEIRNMWNFDLLKISKITR